MYLQEIENSKNADSMEKRMKYQMCSHLHTRFFNYVYKNTNLHKHRQLSNILSYKLYLSLGLNVSYAFLSLVLDINFQRNDELRK